MADAPNHERRAIELGAAGFRVFPLHAVDGKVCRVNGWQKEATGDPQEITELFAGRDVVGVAIATGDDITVIDVDAPGDTHEHDGRATLRERGVKLPATLTVPTASGGEHRFYRTAGPARRTVAGVSGPDGEKLPGVDVRGAGGYVKWHGGDAIPDLKALADAPEWLPEAGERTERGERPGDFLTTARAREKHNWGANAPASDQARAIVDRARELSPRIGHAELLNLTGELAELVSSGVRGATWAVGAARSVYVDGAPRDGHDWAGAFDDALLGCEKLRMPMRTLKLSKAQHRALEAHRKAHGGKGGKPGRLDDLMARTYPPLGWVVEEVIPEGCSLLVAAPKIGKSLLALDVAVACATGRDAFGTILTGEPRPVLYLDLESGERRLQARVRAQGWDEYGGFRYHLDASTAVDVLKRFMRKHRGNRPLAILDTLAAVMTDRGDRATLLKHEYDSLKQFQALTAADPGAAVLIVHHTR